MYLFLLQVHVVHAEFCFNPRLINAEVNKLDKTARSSRRTYSDPSNGYEIIYFWHFQILGWILNAEISFPFFLGLKGGEMNKTFISGWVAYYFWSGFLLFPVKFKLFSKVNLNFKQEW